MEKKMEKKIKDSTKESENLESDIISAKNNKNLKNSTDRKHELESEAEKRGIKYFIPIVTSFKTDVRGPLIPRKATRHLLTEGYAIFGKQHYKRDEGDAEIFAIPDPSTLIQIPWKREIGWLICDLYQSDLAMMQCPRSKLKQLVADSKNRGFVMKCGIEPEFILLKKGEHIGLHDNETDDVDYHSVRAQLRQADFLSRVLDAMDELGWKPYRAEHEAMCNQYEINYQFTDALTTADRHCFMKFLVKELASQEGFRATFMPAPFPGLSMGSGLHVNISLWKEDKNLFMDDTNTRTGLSEIAEQFAAGILKHAAALTAIACPTVNSYKRLHGTDGTPVISWGINCRSALIRIPSNNRLEFRISDGSANPYFLQAALLAAGLDGMDHKLVLAEELRYSEKNSLQGLPLTLLDAVNQLDTDEDLKIYLGHDIVNGFIEKKREQWKDFMNYVTDWETSHADEY